MKKLNFFKFSKSNLGTLDLSASFFRNEGRPAIIHLLRQMYLTGGKPTPFGIAAIRGFLKKINRLKKAQGLVGVVKYLKSCSVLLQQSISGHELSDSGLLGPRVRRNKAGLPSIIPVASRLAIANGNLRVIRLWSTLFSCYRNIVYKGFVSFKTITDPSSGSVISLDKDIKRFINLLQIDNKLIKSVSPFPILTSAPGVIGPFEWSSSFWSLIRSINSFKEYPSLEASLLWFFDYLELSSTKTLYLGLEWFWTEYIKGKIQVSILGRFVKIGDFTCFLTSFLGKLEIKPEPAGKMRVFAMVDPWTQWVMKPLHKFLFHYLGKLPMDGTFDQLKPLKRVPFGKTPIYSLDLSAATDRLPLWLQQDILSQIFGKKFSKNWANLLCGREYQFSHLKKSLFTNEMFLDYHIHYTSGGIKYAVGQPMGALSSWAMLAMTHHLIVQSCAWTCSYPKDQLFTKYAVLGDDIVIWDKQVATKYLNLMKILGVNLGLAKSIISIQGIGLEFAKKTLVEGGDVSPFPLKEAKASHDSIASARELQRKYSLSDLNLIRFLGYGYKVTPGKKTSLAMRLFSLTKHLNSFTPLVILQTFSSNNFFCKEDLFRSAHLYKDMVKFVSSELMILDKKVSNLLYSVVTHMISMEMDSYSYMNMPLLAIYQAKLKRLIKDLRVMQGQCRLAIRLMSFPNYMVNHKFYPLPPYHYFGPGMVSKDIIASIQHLIRITDILSNEAIHDVLSPKRAIIKSSGSFSGKTDKATLIRWNKWFRVFIRTPLLKGS